MNVETHWKKALLSPTALIVDAIKVLSDASLGIVLVSDSDFHLLGTITDGDIRRGLLRGLTIESEVSEVINRAPITVSKNTSREDISKTMSKNRINQIPIIEENSKLVGMYLWRDLNISVARNNIFVIMAGGRGTRLLPRTEKTPKPMLLVGGKPMLERIILRAKAEGFERFILTIHHLGNVIEEYFGDGRSLDVEISYVRESVPLGTAGALKLISPKPQEPIVVTNGDVITDIKYGDILDFHIENEAAATMAVRVHESQNPFGVVKTNGIEISGYEEKPISRSLINAGVYVVNPSTIDLLSGYNKVDMPALFELTHLHRMKSIVFPLHENWLDLGSPIDLAQAESKFEVSTSQDKGIAQSE